MSNYIVSIRYENWLTARNNSFNFLGFSERNKKICHEIRKGEKIILYVCSHKSSFTTVLEVVSSEPKYFSELIWDDIYPLRIYTKPILSLPNEKWVHVQSISRSIAFIKNKDRFGVYFQTPIRKIDDVTADIIIQSMKSQVAQND